MFGEEEMMFNQPVDCTVRADTEVHTWALSRSAYHAKMGAISAAKRTLYREFLQSAHGPPRSPRQSDGNRWKVGRWLAGEISEESQTVAWKSEKVQAAAKVSKNAKKTHAKKCKKIAQFPSFKMKSSLSQFLFFEFVAFAIYFEIV